MEKSPKVISNPSPFRSSLVGFSGILFLLFLHLLLSVLAQSSLESQKNPSDFLKGRTGITFEDIRSEERSLSDKFSVESQQLRADFNIGINFFFNKSYDLAILNFLETIKQGPNHFWARYFLGLSFYKLGNNGEAIREWENLVRLGLDNHGLREKIIQLYKNQEISDRNKLEETFVWITDYPKKREVEVPLIIPINIDVNDQNELIVLDFTLGGFFKINSRGDFIPNQFSIRKDIPFYKPLGNPWDFYRSRDHYWVSDFSSDQLLKVDFNQTSLLTRMGSKGRKPGEFLGPKGITGDSFGNFWVVDSGNSRIQFFNSKGKWLSSFGKRGRDQGEFLNPDDILYHEGSKSLFITDKGNKWVANYNLQGKLIQIIGDGQLKEPTKMNWYQDDLLILDRDSIYKFRLDDENEKLLTFTLKSEQLKKAIYTSFAIANNHYLYLGNAAKRKVEVFAPIEFTYVNWQVGVENLNIKHFPTIQMEVSVRDPLRKPIGTINGEDFKVYENGIEIPHRMVKPPTERRMVVLFEQTLESKERSYLVKSLMNEVFDGIKEGDRLKVIAFNEQGFHEKTEFSKYRLVTINRTLRGEFTKNYFIGDAFKRGATELMNTRYKNAIVLVMISPLEFKATEQVRFEEVLNLARNNFIPVYVFYLGDQKEADAKTFNYLADRLAKETGGGYYHYDVNRVGQFYRDFKNYKSGLYQLQFNSQPNRKLSGFTRKIKVVVRHKKNLGEDGLMVYPIP